MIEKDLVVFLKEKGLTIGSVESFTGGLFTSLITSVPGASSVLKGGIVTYHSELKNMLVDVDKEDIEYHGVVSKEIAKQMAVNGKQKLDVDICVSFTGNAGPTALDNLPVGRIFIGIATSKSINVFEIQMDYMDRNRIRETAVTKAMELIFEIIRKS